MIVQFPLATGVTTPSETVATDESLLSQRIASVVLPGVTVAINVCAVSSVKLNADEFKVIPVHATCSTIALNSESQYSNLLRI